jgi:prepilin signal peptidase PulO-like enzyme (type II secretory pathway)
VPFVVLLLAAAIGWLVGGRVAALVRDAPARVPRRGVAQAITGAAFLLVTGWLLATRSAEPAWAIELLAYLTLAAASIALTLIDLDVHRLPNGIVLPGALVASALFGVACVLGAPWASLGRAGVGMALLAGFYLVLRLISPRGMGGGDVKLAGLLGLYLGWSGWAALVVGASAAFVFGGVFAVVLLATRRARLATAIPFGPWMIAGAWTGLVAGDGIGAWYLNAA